MRINEYITVEQLASGTPIRFVWRGVTYGIVSAPEPWVGRRPWWCENSSVSRGSAAIDLPMWRVDALPLSGARTSSDGVFDLCFEVEVGAWILVNAWSDELDERLFA